MKFLISVVDDLSNSGTPEEMVAIDAFNDKLEANGHWIMAAGINSPEAATLFDNRGGAGIQTSGSFHESDHHISGFWIINAESLEQAKELAAEGSKACNRKVELRPFLG
jgi:hypothetical protein